MDIGSGNGYPESALSNFAPHKFTIDNVECNSTVLTQSEFCRRLTSIREQLKEN